MVFLHLYVLCYNESILIRETIDHYQSRFPKIKITILDNESTDDSVAIATLKGCEILSWSSSGIDDNQYIEFKNNIWKTVLPREEEDDVWIIVADMDEWIVYQDSYSLERQACHVSYILRLDVDTFGAPWITDLVVIRHSGINQGSDRLRILHRQEMKRMYFFQNQTHQLIT
jgi:hypothetical protein